MIHAARPQSQLAVFLPDFKKFRRTDPRTDGQTYVRTTLVKIAITTGFECGWPRGSKILI